MAQTDGVAKAAGGGFARGFFGCFGVMAAIGVAGVALVMCSTISSGDHANAVRDGRATGRDYLAYCAVGIDQARGRFFGMAGAEAWIGEDPSVYPQPLPTEVGCPAKAAIGKAVVRIKVLCANPLEASCVQVEGAERADGRPLRPL